MSAYEAHAYIARSMAFRIHEHTVLNAHQQLNLVVQRSEICPPWPNSLKPRDFPIANTPPLPLGPRNEIVPTCRGLDMDGLSTSKKKIFF